jgi:glyoxylase-like metal-dependent hydrolase (beta-lactamase superfamily II)
MLGGLDPAAAYVVETGAGLVLIDSGQDADAASLKEQLESLGLDWRNVRAILLTHAHIDHSGGAEYFRAATGAKVYAGVDDSAVLKTGTPREAFVGTFYMPRAKFHPTTVDIALKGDEVIPIGEVRFRVLGTPGHTPGSLCYLLERKDRRVLFSGDVIMALGGNQNAGSRVKRPLGTYVAYSPPRYRGDARSFLATLQRLRALPAPDLVLPGHPRKDSTPQSPVMTPQRWETLLDGGIVEMEKLLRRYKADGANYLDGDPKQLLPGLYYLGDLGEVAVYGFLASSRFFVVGAPGGPGLSAFLRERLEKLKVPAAVPTAVLLTSCDPELTAGLKDFVKNSQANIVVAEAGIPAIKALGLPESSIIPASELPARAWFAVKPIPLGGRGLAPIAYQLGWADKTVLFSGKMPVVEELEAIKRLVADLDSSRQNGPAYAASMDRLAEVKPDFWLPAVPCRGQNANWYDNEWETMIEGNRRLVR